MCGSICLPSSNYYSYSSYLDWIAFPLNSVWITNTLKVVRRGMAAHPLCKPKGMFGSHWMPQVQYFHHATVFSEAEKTSARSVASHSMAWCVVAPSQTRPKCVQGEAKSYQPRNKRTAEVRGRKEKEKSKVKGRKGEGTTGQALSIPYNFC